VHVSQAKFSPDGRLVATASWDGTVRLWSVDTGLPIEPPLMHAWGVSSVAFSEDSKLIVTGSLAAAEGKLFRYYMEVANEWHTTPGAARVWDVATLQPMTDPMAHDGTVRRAVFSPDGTHVLTVCKAIVQVWDVSTGRPTGLPMVHLDQVLRAEFNRRGDCIVTSSADGTARLWWASTGRPIAATLKHGDTLVSCACFSPDGRLVATAGHDGTARIWEASTGRPLGEPMRHDHDSDPVQLVQFSADGRQLLSRTADGWFDRGSMLEDLTPAHLAPGSL
jgi:WD40 repeat protein